MSAWVNVVPGGANFDIRTIPGAPMLEARVKPRIRSRWGTPSLVAIWASKLALVAKRAPPSWKSLQPKLVGLPGTG